jgi:hypothetical protein
MTSVRSPARDSLDAAEREFGLASNRLHLLQLGREVERHHLVARRLVWPAAVDRVRKARLLQRHRCVGHHRRTFRDPREDSLASCVQVIDDLDAKSVFLEGDDGVRECLIVGKRRETVGCICPTHY